MAESTNGAANGQTEIPQAQLSLQKIYVKDVSFEAPGAPQVFQTQAAQPNVELNLSQRVTQLGEAAFEVGDQGACVESGRGREFCGAVKEDVG